MILENHDFYDKDPVAFIDYFHNHMLGHMHCDNCGYPVETRCQTTGHTF